jgi:acetylornithine deacetylase
LRVLLSRPPFEVDEDAPLVDTLAREATRVLGRRPAMVGQTPWMDSALLSAAGIETVIMGGVGAGAHAAEEWVDLDSLARLAGVLAATAAEYCR